jgi:hypothetical protein
MKAVHAVAAPEGLLIALVVGISGLLIGIGCLAAVVLTNFGSRTLVAAFTATFGTALALLIAIYFDLRGKTDSALMAAEYTVDLSKPQIRQWAYPDSGAGWRLVNEVGASDALAKSNPGAFNGDLDKLTIDMTIRSVLVYFFAEQFDWQLKQTRVQGTTTGTQILTEPLSKPDECATFTSSQIADKLSKARNLFDQVGNFTRQQICLPPGSSVDIGPNEVSVRNALVHLSFVVEPTGSVFYGKPRTSGLEAPSLPDGRQQYETRANNVRASVTYNWLRAHHPDLDIYKAWADRVVSGAQKWFQGQT